jgi:hypothetical protein
LLADKKGLEENKCPIEYLKTLMFKVAENNFKPSDPNDWPPVDGMNDKERKNNSSIFLDAHESETGEGGSSEVSLHATVSSTLIILTENNEMYFWERIYHHSEKPGIKIREVSSLELDLAE